MLTTPLFVPLLYYNYYIFWPPIVTNAKHKFVANERKKQKLRYVCRAHDVLAMTATVPSASTTMAIISAQRLMVIIIELF